MSEGGRERAGEGIGKGRGRERGRVERTEIERAKRVDFFPDFWQG